MILKKERFETKFYELLRLHKDNVNEIEIIGKYRGRKAFVKMFLELRFIYYSIIKTKDDWNNMVEKNVTNDDPKIKNDEDALMELAFTIFFFGVGDLSEGTLIYKHSVHAPFMVECINQLIKLQRKFDLKIKDDFQYFQIKSSLGELELEIDYYPFDGHASKLAHYYRHLYQLIKFIAANENIGLTQEQKYDYIKTVRAQLSNHEQALIYYNSFFEAGKIWWEDKSIKYRNIDGSYISYFLDFAMIKNLPFNLTKFGKDPRIKFREKLKERGLIEEGIDKRMSELFEWIGG